MYNFQKATSVPHYVLNLFNLSNCAARYWAIQAGLLTPLTFTQHRLSLIFATATVLAFVLFCDSRFNFHCYTQKSAQKCAATSRDFLRERLQSAFTLTNQLR